MSVSAEGVEAAAGRGLLQRPAIPELIRRHYPAYRGPVDVYRLQLHIAMRVLEPIFDRYLDRQATVADLGCGSGTLLHELAPRVASVVGVDQDDGAFWKYPDLDLRKGTLYDLPIETASVQLATSKWVFEHLEHPERAIAEVDRILTPGGVAIIAAPNVLHPSMLLSHLLPTRLKQWGLGAFDGIQEELVMPTFYRANTERALDGHFARASFEKLEFAYWGDPSYWLFSTPLFRAAECGRTIGERVRGFRRLRMNLVGVYRKAAVSRRTAEVARSRGRCVKRPIERSPRSG